MSFLLPRTETLGQRLQELPAHGVITAAAGSRLLASFSGVALAVGVAQVGDGEFGVVFEGVEGFVAEEIFDMEE